MDLQAVWFWLVGILIIGYAVLDGFDLGVGVLHLFMRTNEDRRILLNAIGPVWDGNEVWLLTGGGALFAAFPPVYATVFSGFYLAMMLLLFALIFRAVSLEFRGKVNSKRWRRVWDWSFGIGSVLPAVLFGVAFGNILCGVPIDANGVYTGTFVGLLNPYAILVGLLSLALFTLHGALYLAMKTSGELQKRLTGWIVPAWITSVVLYAVATVATLFVSPFLFEGMLSLPATWVLMLLLLGAMIAIPFVVKAGRFAVALLASSVLIASAVGLAALGLFPRLVPSSISLAYSMTAYTASSSQETLQSMFIIALVGMPVVILYTVFIYRQFKGKVVITDESY